MSAYKPTKPQPRIVAQEVRVATENRLVGEWLISEQTSGALTVDLRRMDDVRTGIRLALLDA